MRVLVTGAGGFIGARVVRSLAGKQEVVAVDRHEDRLERLAGLDPSVTTACVDLSSSEQVSALLDSARPTEVVHLAWHADPEDYLSSHANLDSLHTTVRFVDTALRAGCRRVIMAGSCAEYAPKDSPLTESDPTTSRTLYGATKIAAAEITRILAAEQGAQLVWARLFHLHGPGEDKRRLIPWVAQQLTLGVPVDLTDGLQVRDHLHVDDVAAGLTALLAPSAEGVFNVCSGVPVTLREVLETVGDLLHRRELLRFGRRERRPDEPSFLAGDATKLRALGWRPRFGLRDGLADALPG